MQNRVFRISAAIHLCLIIVTMMLCAANVGQITSGHLSLGTGKGGIMVTQGDMTAKIIFGGLAMGALALTLLIRIEKGKKKPGWLIAGNLFIIPILLLFAAFYHIVADDGKQDAALQFLPLAALALGSAFLSGAWASNGRIGWTLFIIIDIAAIVGVAREAAHANCPLWRANGHHVYYYYGDRKQQEFTMDCGTYKGESKVWYTSGQLQQYVLYDEHGGIDSEIEYYESGNPKYAPHVAHNKSNISYTYTDHSPLQLDRSLRIFDSVTNGKPAHFEEEISYGAMNKPHYRDLRNDSSRIRYGTLYYSNGTISYAGSMYYEARPSPTHPGKQILNTGTWYKYNTSGRLIDSLVMSDSVQSVPAWWDR